MTAPRALDPAATYLHAADDGTLRAIDVTPSFWPDLMSGKLELTGGRLVTASDYTADWPQWERHPAGDELLVVLAGAGVFVLELEDGERSVALRAGQVFVVPRGIWHTARFTEPRRILFATAGAGTEHRPV